MSAAKQLWQQCDDPEPADRRRENEIEFTVIISGHRRNVKYATYPGAIADVGERDRAFDRLA